MNVLRLLHRTRLPQKGLNRRFLNREAVNLEKKRDTVIDQPLNASCSTEREKSSVSLGYNIFTGGKTVGKKRYIELDPTTYPNPLYDMSKAELIALNEKEYKHLTQIPYKSHNETNKFCYNISNIVDELIMTNTKKAAKYLTTLSDEYTHSTIVASLENKFKGDKIKNSLLEYAINPSGVRFRSSFFKILDSIHASDVANERKTQVLMEYLAKVASIDVVNEKVIVLRASFFDKIFALVPTSSYAEFYACLLNINIQPSILSKLYTLKYTLVMGSNSEKFVVRTGWLKPKWHDLQTPVFSENHKRRMINFFSVKDLRQYAIFAIQKKEIVDSNLYLGLLLKKFERKYTDIIDGKSDNILEKTSFTYDIQAVLTVVLKHVMTFNGPKNCIPVLKYMIDNNLEIKFDNILTILQHLRESQNFEEALVLINEINLHTLNSSNTEKLVHEILLLIKRKFPKTPKIYLGYVVSMLSKETSRGEESQCINLLDRLGIISLVYKNSTTDSSSYPEIKRANVDPLLTIPGMQQEVLLSVYETLLNSLDPSERTPEMIVKMYMDYSKIIKEEINQDAVNSTSTYKFLKVDRDNLNDQVVTLFIKYLLKKKPESNSMNLSKSTLNYDTAKFIMSDFLENFMPSRRNRSVFPFELLIYCGLMIHNDYAFVSRMIRVSRSWGLPFSFNQIYPFIMYHYTKGEYKQAESWYRELVKHGVKAKASPVKNLFKIARELNWGVTGFVYRKLGIHRNHKRRKEMSRIHADQLIPHTILGSPVTSEYSSAANSEQFTEDIAFILKHTDVSKSAPYYEA
ncbi:Piso0_001247 [Millerozyma farinosa CBS 7064]|uniref:Piso0_001247 protein n=1 Tax=Pichia sorbitophila (strain ATCC MYA-4447 / BCRC 22081 / CBS 7064 / NBRC 10061 / NRRL Y-12695) TaxID=559304 RepID=G8YMN1_PICSO|nr:Piso0_001247 [Millerozyma farinosa CBS 7064]